jgi:hypothetical protein
MFRLPTLTVEIDDDHSDLTPQQRLVLEQQFYRLAQIDRANEHLDSKALSLLQSAGLILALIGVLRIPGVITQEVPSVWAWVGIAVSFLAFMGMVGLMVVTWSPVDNPVPGTQDWDKLYDEYIDVDRNTTYSKILSNYLDAYELSYKTNQRKAKMLQGANILFLILIGGLLVLALLA